MDKKRHLYELQVYSGIAILFVIIIHSNATYLIVTGLNKYTTMRLMYNYIDGYELQQSIFPTIYNVIDKIIHIAVPMFIFIAGYKYQMNSKTEPYNQFCYKKYKTMFLPFFLISIFFVCYKIAGMIIRGFIIGKHINIIDILYKFTVNLIKTFLGYNFAYQLWYVPLYLFIVLSYPIIIRYLKNDEIRMFIFILLAIFWTSMDAMNLKIISRYPYPISFIYYFYLYELGIIFYRHNFKFKKGNVIILTYVILIISTCFIKSRLVSCLFAEVVLPPIAVTAYYYLSLKIIHNKLFLILGKYSYYIFLFHDPIFLTKLSYLLFKFKLYTYCLMLILVPIVTIVLSICFYKIFHKTFIGRYLFGEKKYKKVKVISIAS